MEYKHDIPQSSENTSLPASLQVDFSWKKGRSIITDKANPSAPIYNVHYGVIKSPSLTFKSADDKEVIGTGTLHAVSINAKYEVHGRAGTLKALARLKTRYTHLSYAYSDDPETPVAMNWTSSCGLKNWDFICLDEAQDPVAKFSINVWALRKFGQFEFLGEKASNSVALRDELVVTGFTLFYLMYLRTNNIFSLVGAAIAKPGPIDIEKEKEKQKQKEQGEAADVK
ncbi:hypothetical protein PV08_07691 [Exophiala spinifera]|uniref:Uncharacterized protein n=1 Tax=Exophiala spinifera TaxID=91928 RepID=A0A0D1YIZ1_9EURO|nr:uncharacterized protein PV08_07691 [Exophiala spinifera]KIW14906.1 hypothetical protein PV08_07691 [Exophiala spinifera]